MVAETEDLNNQGGLLTWGPLGKGVIVKLLPFPPRRLLGAQDAGEGLRGIKG